MDGNKMNTASNIIGTQGTGSTTGAQVTGQNKPGKGPGIASMVLGIIALITTLLSCCLPFGYLLAAILGLLSIIFGIVAIAKKRGKDMGVAGIICSVVGLLFAILYFVFVFLITAGVIAIPASMLEYMENSGYLEEYYDYDDWDMDDGYQGDYEIFDENGEIDWDEVEDIINGTDWESLDESMYELDMEEIESTLEEVDWEEVESTLEAVDWEELESALEEADWEELESILEDAGWDPSGENVDEVDWKAIEEALDEVDWEAIEEMLNEE